jgi:hypothetical protein
MKRKVGIIAEQITGVVKEWPAVDAIALGDPIGEDMYDPYFFMSIDVYYTGALPPVEKRMEYFSFGGAFESAQANKKDRFIVDDVAVRIEYKEMERVEELVDGRDGLLASLRDSGTYGFYRLLNSEIMYKRTDWTTRMQGILQNMPPSFWNLLRYSFQARMEHYLSDLGAATVRNDSLFFLVSASGFIRSVCSILFAINRLYEPSVRLLSVEVKKLPVLPEPFLGRYESFLRNDPDLTPERKREIAELMAKSIINL